MSLHVADEIASNMDSSKHNNSFMQPIKLENQQNTIMMGDNGARFLGPNETD